MAMETARTGDFALRTISILTQHGSATIAQVAEQLDVSRTAAQRILTTLHSAGVVRRATDHRFELGPALLRIAEGVVTTFARRSRGILRDVARRLDTSIVLAARDGDESIVVQQAVGTGRLMHIEYNDGFRAPLSVGASGLAILAYLSPEERARVRPSITDEQVAEITAQGYARSEGAIRPGMLGIAAPIYNAAIGVFASVSAVAPTAFAPPLEVMVAEVTRAAALLGERSDAQHGAAPARGKDAADV